MVAVLTNHVVELAVPFLYFAPQPYAAIAGFITIGFQLWLMVTGNFSWPILLTAVLAFPTFTDAQISRLLSGAFTPPATAAMPDWYLALLILLAVVVLVLSARPTVNMLSASQIMNTSFDPLNLVNSYGAFGSITKTRYELVVEGTNGEPSDESGWEPYSFYSKPTDTGRRQPQIAPYHHRLGWQFWFAAMSPVRRHPWVVHFVAKLLHGDEATLSLLRSAPFPADDPPEHVRIMRYEYRFTTPAERAETGDWWDRDRVSAYYGPVSLSDPQLQRELEPRGWTR